MRAVRWTWPLIAASAGVAAFARGDDWQAKFGVSVSFAGPHP